MPIIKSAKKRVRTAKKASVRNSKVKRILRASVKDFHAAASAKTQGQAQSAIDKALKKNIIHKNKAARLKKRLAAHAKAAGAKPAAKATKPAAKAKAPAKKPTAKKAPAKK
ncbi:MAG: ribosomal protein [Candidatus Saccharibacteria bacterium]|nr:ribosomal protein [Candidatus Saccharibacteria bacterium]